MPGKLDIQLFSEGAEESAPEESSQEEDTSEEGTHEESVPERTNAFADYEELKEKNARFEAMIQANRSCAVERQCEAWLSEARELKNEHPGFDLDTEMKNPTFRTGLRLGMDMKSLYRGMHFDEAVESIRRRAAISAAEGVRKSLSRPGEVGIKGPRAVRSVTDVAALSDEEMEEIVKRIAKGDKVSFS